MVTYRFLGQSFVPIDRLYIKGPVHSSNTNGCYRRWENKNMPQEESMRKLVHVGAERGMADSILGRENVYFSLYTRVCTLV